MSGEQAVLWTPELEVSLFHSMYAHKPVGLNKHFNMICIQFRLSRAIGRQISTRQIWNHLKTMYDIETLDENECLPFPTEEKDFTLPDDYGKHKPGILSPKQPLSPKEEGPTVTPHESVRKRLRVSSNGSSPSSPTVHGNKRRR